MYFIGQGVPLDTGQAVQWCMRAAEQGLAKAQFNLETMYMFLGNSVIEDEEQAFTWIMKAAKQGEVRAQHNLGMM